MLRVTQFPLANIRKGVIDCIKAFSETDFTEDLKRLNVPTLILHGDDDQIVPIWRFGTTIVKDRQGCRAENLSGRRTARARLSRTRLTPIC